MGSKVLIKKISDETWQKYTTKENKVYDADNFSHLEPEMGYDFRTITVASQGITDTQDIYRNEHLLMRDWETGWEMLVKNEDVRPGVNIVDDF